MISEEDKKRLKFEFATANLQSISSAQGKYVTALLVYLCFVWAVFVTGSNQTVRLSILGFELNTGGIWSITPFVTMVLTLAVIGSLNAASSAFKEVQKTQEQLLGEVDDISFFCIDTHKNIVDYLGLLQISGIRTRKQLKLDESVPFWLRLHNLIFPSIFLLSLFTSGWGIYKLSFDPKSHPFVLVGGVCIVIQSIFTIRPLIRMVGRVFIIDKNHSVYN